MIYLDNAATTYPKPPQVSAAVQRALRQYGANPGRAGHRMSLKTAEAVYHVREQAAAFFGAPGPENVAFVMNCTQALNMVIKGAIKPGGHVVVSCLEHNAVMRPLETLRRRGIITYTEAQVVPGDNDATLDAFRQAMQENTCLCVCTHVSNVWGICLPIERIAALCHAYRVPFCADCAQSAGVLPISMTEAGLDYVCAPGHKGLYGPMGTGLLLALDGAALDTLIEGGTGTASESLVQPAEMPERFESGTINVPGILGLGAGISFVQQMGIQRIYQQESALVCALYDQLKHSGAAELYAPRPQPPYFAPLLSFNLPNQDSEDTAAALDRRGFAVRAGLHCAPRAHAFYGTLERGAVRMCPSVFVGRAQVRAFGDAVLQISSKNKKAGAES
ncbi:MAG: aminotransferase class V-fold PLP-dependent enzyme [Oscillospiraceae bacterium]|jgi:cysteine desulfurase family protein|nr:aminotransferase class V-fold PLP-dependent enzyme [Oscillospiraceae bacterium]MDD3261205.1 aminotransferase class V-fold PLP-dependent enzyme [Oscillospiraceae bacterium]